MAEKAALTQGLKGGEKTLAEYYIDQLAGGDQAATANERLFSDAALPTTEVMILNTAVASGLLTRADIENLIEVTRSQLAQLPPEERQAQTARMNALESNLGDALVVNADILQGVITNDTDVDVAEYTQQLTTINENLPQIFERLQAAKKADPFSRQTQELQTEYDKVMQIRDGYQIRINAADFANVDNLNAAITNYETMLENGQIPQDTARAVAKGIRTGDWETVIVGLGRRSEIPKRANKPLKNDSKNACNYWKPVEKEEILGYLL